MNISNRYYYIETSSCVRLECGHSPVNSSHIIYERESRSYKANLYNSKGRERWLQCRDCIYQRLPSIAVR